MAIILHELVGSDHARPFSPHCWKTVMCLRHKGLDYRTTPVPFTRVPHVEDGANRIVPVIRDGDRVVADSFAIALYLEETYPDRPTLFGGEGGKAMARFVEAWSQTQLHTAISMIALLDIHAMLAPEDQAYFRASREGRFGRPLEDVAAAGTAEVEVFARRLEPIRVMLQKQPFIGGDGPLFADYIVFGALQWARICSPARLLAEGDAVTDWFERCLDLYDGHARAVPAAA